MRFAVILVGMVVANNRYNHFRRNRRDLLVSGCYVERYLAEVRACVRKVCSAQRHCSLACIGTGRCRCRRILRRLREVVRSVQVVADVRDLVTSDRMRFAVILVGMVVADNRYNHFRRNRLDLLITVGVCERDIVEVRVQVLEVIARQTHHGLALVLTGRARFLTGLQLEVIFGVQITADAVYRVAGDRMIFAVVVHAARIAVQGDRHVDRINIQNNICGDACSRCWRNGISSS